MTKAEAIRILRALISKLNFAKSELNRAVEAQALYFELSLSCNPFSIVRPKDRGKLSGVRYYKDWANRLENYIIKTLKEAEDILSQSELFDDAIDYTINEDAAGDVLLKRYVEDIKGKAFDLYDKLCELDLFQSCENWEALADRLLGIDENLQIFGDIVEPNPAGKDEPKDTEEDTKNSTNGGLPPEFDTNDGRKIITNFIEMGFVSETNGGYKWNGTKGELALFAELAAEKLCIKHKWKVFESIFNTRNLAQSYHKSRDYGSFGRRENDVIKLVGK